MSLNAGRPEKPGPEAAPATHRRQEGTSKRRGVTLLELLIANSRRAAAECAPAGGNARGRRAGRRPERPGPEAAPATHGRQEGTSKRRGVTLLELLIAISLLSLLSLGMLMAMRVGLNAMTKTNAKLIANRRAFSVQTILRSQIAGLMPVQADCFAPGQPPTRVRFFEGQPGGMRFVSSYSLQEAARGYPRVLEFAVTPGENGRGVRLIVNEFLYTGPASAGCLGLAPGPAGMLPQFRPVIPGPYSFVLADKLAFCRLSYRELQPQPALDVWWPQWDSPQWPSAIRVDLAPLDPDPSRVPLTSVVAPVYIHRSTNVRYYDTQ